MLTPQDILGSGGLIARRLDRYEHRQEQLAMADAVYRAFCTKKHLAVEAGTGVGKSFAYLVPAILQTAGEITAGQQTDSELTGEESENVPPRAVVSTHTISLQEQLLEKDIPFLQAVLPFEFTAVLVKGRSNYLCLRRFHTALQKQDTLFDDRKGKEFQRLSEWSKNTDDGSKSSLNPEPDWEIWNETCCETGNCSGKKCAHASKCFYNTARRRIANAQILVVNHALLFSDMAVRRQGGSILPVYQYLIFDEAHTIEQAAADHLGLSVTQSQIEYNLNRLYNGRTQKGLLMNTDIPAATAKSGQQAVEECFYGSELLFQYLSEWLQKRPGSNGRIREINVVSNPLAAPLRKLSAILREIADKLPKPDDRTELKSARDRMADIAGNVNVWLTQSLPEDSVYWLESSFTGRGRQRISINASPIDIGPILREHLFNKTASVVLASATLATGRQSS
ncbi:MAG: hypothetical protein LBH00_12490 [Planctomycetaceae bacterium]|jgi:ATP-dependent DNA helicase DinG|nr:hypothetical protein [Planctomycetaceae bacterium]